MYGSAFDTIKTTPMSPLVLSDSLITLAQHAHRAGYPRSARRLLRLAIAVLDEAPQDETELNPAAAL